MLLIILPLILDYLSKPFELIKCSKAVNKNCKKYGLTVVDYHEFNKNILKYYKWKYLNIGFLDSGFDNLCKNNLYDSDLQYLTNINKLILWNNNKITDDGLKYLNNIRYLNLSVNNKITNEGLKYIPNIRILYLNNSKKITDDGLKYLKNVSELDLFWNQHITENGLKNIKGCIVTNWKLKYNKRKVE